jgi:sigma-54-interacting transcriptional regulator
MGGLSLENPDRFSSSINRSTAPQPPKPPHGGDLGVLASVHSDLNVARITRANVLVVGGERLVVSLVSAVIPDANSGVVISCQDGRMLLPPASSRVGTVVVRDVDALTTEQQQMLFEWLESARQSTQVVSTSSVPLLPMVETGTFNDALYYRLNTIYIDPSK